MMIEPVACWHACPLPDMRHPGMPVSEIITVLLPHHTSLSDNTTPAYLRYPCTAFEAHRRDAFIVSPYNIMAALSKDAQALTTTSQGAHPVRVVGASTKHIATGGDLASTALIALHPARPRTVSETLQDAWRMTLWQYLCGLTKHTLQLILP
jgi:hypothetical protein